MSTMPVLLCNRYRVGYTAQNVLRFSPGIATLCNKENFVVTDKLLVGPDPAHPAIACKLSIAIPSPPDPTA